MRQETGDLLSARWRTMPSYYAVVMRLTATLNSRMATISAFRGQSSMFCKVEGDSRHQQYEVPFALTCSESAVHVGVHYITASCYLNNSRTVAHLVTPPQPKVDVFVEIMTSTRVIRNVNSDARRHYHTYTKTRSRRKTQDREQWRAILKEAKVHQGL
jgi:hypothetical protein